MLGYRADYGPQQLITHHRELKGKIPEKWHKELDCAYKWVSNPNFLDAMRQDTIEGWNHLKRSMINPPDIVIDHALEQTNKHICLDEPKLVLRSKLKTPTCALCDRQLAKSILEKVKFTIIICKCSNIWTHNDCCEKYILSKSACSLCKDIFILSPFHSTLRSTIAKF